MSSLERNSTSTLCKKCFFSRGKHELRRMKIVHEEAKLSANCKPQPDSSSGKVSDHRGDLVAAAPPIQPPSAQMSAAAINYRSCRLAHILATVNGRFCHLGMGSPLEIRTMALQGPHVAHGVRCSSALARSWALKCGQLTCSNLHFAANQHPLPTGPRAAAARTPALLRCHCMDLPHQLLVPVAFRRVNWPPLSDPPPIPAQLLPCDGETSCQPRSQANCDVFVLSNPRSLNVATSISWYRGRVPL